MSRPDIDEYLAGLNEQLNQAELDGDPNFPEFLEGPGAIRY